MMFFSTAFKFSIFKKLKLFFWMYSYNLETSSASSSSFQMFSISSSDNL